MDPIRDFDQLVDELSDSGKKVPVWIGMFGPEHGSGDGQERQEYIRLWTYSDKETVRDLVRRIEGWIAEASGDPDLGVESVRDLATYLLRNLLNLPKGLIDVSLGTGPGPLDSNYGDMNLMIGIGYRQVTLDLSVSGEAGLRAAGKEVSRIAVQPSPLEESDIDPEGLQMALDFSRNGATHHLFTRESGENETFFLDGSYKGENAKERAKTYATLMGKSGRDVAILTTQQLYVVADVDDELEEDEVPAPGN